MTQIRGTAGYNLGHQNPFGGPGRADATSDPSPLDAIREQTSKIEDWLDTASDPLKPYVPKCSEQRVFCLNSNRQMDTELTHFALSSDTYQPLAAS
jgi:hypothetical protein